MTNTRSTFCITGIISIALLLPAIASAQLSEAPDLSLRDTVPVAKKWFGSSGSSFVPYTTPGPGDLELSSPAESNLFKLPLLGRLRDFGYRVSSSDGNKFDALTRHALFVDVELPWEWSAQSGYAAAPYLSLEVGRFSRGSEQRSFVSIGPVVRLTHQRWGTRLFVDAGLSPTIIDGAKYGDTDFGTSFNITSHLGLGLRFGATEDHFVKVRYEHISNGGIDEDNPGVNMVGIDFVFWGK